MREEKVSFFSDGYRLSGSYYYPDDVAADAPDSVLIINSGYQGFNEFYPHLFATALTAAGHTCFGFDYRSMGTSEGEPGAILIHEQAADIRNAVTFVRASAARKDLPVSLMGWGMGGAGVLLAAQHCEHLSHVVVANGFYRGDRWLKSIHTYDAWMDLLGEVRADRDHRVLTGEAGTMETFRHYPLDPSSQHHVNVELAGITGFGNPTRVQFTESIIDMDAEAAASRLHGVPLLIAHGRYNRLHPVAEAEHLFRSANSPKQLFLFDGFHNDFMYADHPAFLRLCTVIDEFMSSHTRPGIHDDVIIDG